MPPEPRVEPIPEDDPTTGTPGATEPSTEPLQREYKSKAFAQLAADVLQMYAAPIQTLQLLAVAKQDQALYDATLHYAKYCPVVADQWVQLAERNPRVKVMLDNMVGGTVIGALISTHVMMLSPFLPEHLLARLNPFGGGVPSGNGNGNGAPQPLG